MSRTPTEEDIFFVKMACLFENQRGSLGVIVVDEKKEIIFHDSGVSACDNLLLQFHDLTGFTVYLSRLVDSALVDEIYSMKPRAVYYSTKQLTENDIFYIDDVSAVKEKPTHRLYRMALFTDHKGRLSVEACEISESGMTMCRGFVGWLGHSWKIDTESEKVIDLQAKALVANIGSIRYRIAFLKDQSGGMHIETAFSERSHRSIESADGFIAWDGDWKEFSFSH